MKISRTWLSMTLSAAMLVAGLARAAEAITTQLKVQVADCDEPGSQCRPHWNIGACSTIGHTGQGWIIISSGHHLQGKYTGRAEIMTFDGLKQVKLLKHELDGSHDLSLWLYEGDLRGWSSLRVSEAGPQTGDRVAQFRQGKGQYVAQPATVRGLSSYGLWTDHQAIPGDSGSPVLAAGSRELVGVVSAASAGVTHSVSSREVCRLVREFFPDFQRRPAGETGSPQPGQLASTAADFDGVIIVLAVPELLSGSSGLFAEIAGPSAYGIPKRLVGQVSDGKARFVAIPQRNEPARFAEFCQVMSLPTDQPTLSAFLPRKGLGLAKGLVAKRIESEIVARLDGVMFSPVFERTSPSDYTAGLEVVDKTYSTEQAIGESSIIERAKLAAVDELKGHLPDRSALASAVAEKLKGHLPEQVKEKADNAAWYWKAYERGGLGALLLSIIGLRLSSRFKENKLLSLIESFRQPTAEPAAPAQTARSEP